MTYLLNNTDKKIILDRNCIYYNVSINTIFVYWDNTNTLPIDVTNISDESFNSIVDTYHN